MKFNLDTLVEEFESLEMQLSDPEIISRCCEKRKRRK